MGERVNAIEKLMKEIEKKNSRVVVGIDPTIEMVHDLYFELPLEMDRKRHYALFCYAIIDAVCDIVPAIKPNIAYFEKFGYYKEYKEICKYAKSKGLIVIADAKRADIGHTSEQYAEAFLSEKAPYDFLTVNPYFGIDGIQPFIETCNKNGKGIFVLTKTSNPSSSEIQDLILEDGRKLYEKVGDLVSSWGDEKGIVDKSGYNNVGAVVGATHIEEAIKLRNQMQHTFFLVPGYGAQGGTANDIAKICDENGGGFLVNASRTIIAAYKKEKYKGMKIAIAARQATIDMNEEINNAIELSKK